LKLVADESVDRPIVERLRRDGHSVESIAERSPGVDDQQVLKLSVESQAVLLTADRDFGEMVIRHGLASTGIVLVRLSGLRAEQKAELVAVAIAAHGDTLLDSFAVISPGAVRIRQGAMRREPEPDE